MSRAGHLPTRVVYCTFAGTLAAAAAMMLGLTLPAATQATGGSRAMSRTTRTARHSRHERDRSRGRQKVLDGRAHAAIIGGHLADTGTFPWLAYIADFRSSEEVGLCTGTVVASNLILTAAHCVEELETGIVHEPSGFRVVTGNVDWASSPRQISTVSRVIVDPDFDRETLSGDAALLALETPTTAPVIPLASWPSDREAIEAGTPAIIAGWGKTFYEQESLPETLRWAETVVQGPEWCTHNASYIGAPFDQGTELCAIDPPSDETGVCYGDSGGPLIALASGSVVEIGITSHIQDECLTTYPDVFTRADSISSWVNTWIEALKPPPTPPSAPPAPLPTPSIQPQPTPNKPAPISSGSSSTVSAPSPAPQPPNEPGYYASRLSKLRKIVIHVSGDGKHIVGLSIKMPVHCQHGWEITLNESWLSYADDLSINNGTARTTLEWLPDKQTQRGTIGLVLRFTASGVIEGRLRIHLPYRNKRIGLCSGTLGFAAKVKQA
jgi:secreted trypsin-like serine protease